MSNSIPQRPFPGAIPAAGPVPADRSKSRMTRRAHANQRTSGIAIAALVLAACLGAGMMPAPATAETFGSLTRMGPGAAWSERVVTQGEWAANLVDVLGLTRALTDDAVPEDVFGLLCPSAVERVGPDSGGSKYHTLVDVPTRSSPSDPVRMTIMLHSPAIYMLSVEGSGPQRWSVDQNVIGHLDPSGLGVDQATALVPLRRGPHEITGYLTHDASVERVDLTAYRPLCIAPAEGWRAGRPLTHGDRARTLVRALGIEQRLPESGEPILVEGESYANASAWGKRSHRKFGEPASAHTWAAAEGSPAEFTYRIRIDDPSVFTVEALLHGEAPQLWSIDGRHRMTVRPGRGAEKFVWTDVVTLPLTAGEHVIRALIPEDSGIDVIRLVRRDSGASDYLDLIEEAGFRGGAPAAYVTRAAAYRSLSNPTFVAQAFHFLDQVADGRMPVLLVEYDSHAPYSRPLSPMLPPEL